MKGPAGFGAQPHNRARGSVAEDDAAAYLRRRGYLILERNVTTHAGEIDVVAEQGGTLCFIEVKARADDRHGLAVEAVDRRKQRRLARAAGLYLAAGGHQGPCRFDVLGMDRQGERWRFTLIQNAFDAV